MEDKNLGESDSNLSFFNESFSVEEVLKKNQNESSDQKILKFEEKFLKKKRRVLTEEEKMERIQKNIDRYCKRNEEMLSLLEKIDAGEITHKNINRMMRLLAIDLSDTKKLINKKALIVNQKREIFNRLLEFTYEDYQYFWYQLTEGKFKKGKAQLIKSSNISKAKEILRQIEEKNKNKNNINNNNNENEKNENNINNNLDNNAENGGNNNKINEEEKNKKKDNRTVKEIIQAATLRDIENERMDQEFFENSDISSEDSLSSSLEDSEDDDDIISNSKSSNKENNKEKEEDKELKAKKEQEEKLRKEKEEKDKKEKEQREKAEKLRKEKEERERKEKEEKERKLKMLMDDEDEIDIFN